MPPTRENRKIPPGNTSQRQEIITKGRKNKGSLRYKQPRTLRTLQETVHQANIDNYLGFTHPPTVQQQRAEKSFGISPLRKRIKKRIEKALLIANDPPGQQIADDPATITSPRQQIENDPLNNKAQVLPEKTEPRDDKINNRLAQFKINRYLTKYFIPIATTAIVTLGTLTTPHITSANTKLANPNPIVAPKNIEGNPNPIIEIKRARPAGQEPEPGRQEEPGKKTPEMQQTTIMEYVSNKLDSQPNFIHDQITLTETSNPNIKNVVFNGGQANIQVGLTNKRIIAYTQRTAGEPTLEERGFMAIINADHNDELQVVSSPGNTSIIFIWNGTQIVFNEGHPEPTVTGNNLTKDEKSSIATDFMQKMFEQKKPYELQDRVPSNGVSLFPKGEPADLLLQEIKKLGHLIGTKIGRLGSFITKDKFSYATIIGLTMLIKHMIAGRWRTKRDERMAKDYEAGVLFFHQQKINRLQKSINVAKESKKFKRLETLKKQLKTENEAMNTYIEENYSLAWWQQTWYEDIYSIVKLGLYPVKLLTAGVGWLFSSKKETSPPPPSLTNNNGGNNKKNNGGKNKKNNDGKNKKNNDGKKKKKKKKK